jgi:hypothetical protein
MPAKRELTGRRFGRLLVIGELPIRSGGSVVWLCVCSCGQEVNVASRELVVGKTSSCGCLRKERALAANTKHGHRTRVRQTPTCSSWKDMKRRCTDPSYKCYHRYGGRGIAVCDRWLGDDGFQNFLSDMGEKPSTDLSIDRIDNDKGYFPENCRWATAEEQANNRSVSAIR